MGNRPLLTGRKMVSFTSSGAPTEWLEKEGGWDALRTTFDTHIANVCGLHAIDHIHFGHVVQGAPPESIRAHLEDVAGHVTRLFPASLH
jgi:NAD(P)H dehydrogenase (quinone)